MVSSKIVYYSSDGQMFEKKEDAEEYENKYCFSSDVKFWDERFRTIEILKNPKYLKYTKFSGAKYAYIPNNEDLEKVKNMWNKYIGNGFPTKIGLSILYVSELGRKLEWIDLDDYVRCQINKYTFLKKEVLSDSAEMESFKSVVEYLLEHGPDVF